MRKRVFRLVLSVFFLMNAVSASASDYTGQTAFLTTQTVFADFEGTIEEVFLTEGMAVSEGDAVMTLKTERVYCALDATVRGVTAEEGSVLDKKVFSLEPKEKYKLLASTSYAYNAGDNTVIHAGEKVYMACVNDFTHLAAGYVASVDQDEYTVYTTHGTLYLGEAVNVYRDPDRSYLSRIGRATVYAAEPVDVKVTGRVIGLYAGEGDRVEKGEILMEYLPGENAPRSPEIAGYENGIVTGVYVKRGDAVSKGDKLYEYALKSDIGVKIIVPQPSMAGIQTGVPVDVVFYTDPLEKAHPATVAAVQSVSEPSSSDAEYEVYIRMEMPGDIPRTGMTAYVRYGNSRH